MLEETIKKYFIVIVICCFLYIVSDALTPFITGLLSAYLFYPLERYLTKYTSKPLISSLVIVLGLIGAISFFIWFFFQFIYGEFLDVLSKMPPATEALFNFLGIKLDFTVNNAFDDLNKYFSFEDIISKLISYFFILLYKVLKGNFSLFFDAFSFCYITPVSTIVFLANMHKFDKIFSPILPEQLYNQIVKIILSMNIAIQKYLYAQLVISVLQTIFYYILLNAVHMSRINFLLSIVFVSSFIPSFGSLCGMLAFILVAFIENSPLTHGFVVFSLGYIYENNGLIPYFIGHNLYVSSFIIWCSVILGGKLLGVIGLFFGIPIGAVIYELYSQKVAAKNDV